MSADGAAATSTGVASNVRFQAVAGRTSTADMRRKAAIRGSETDFYRGFNGSTPDVSTVSTRALNIACFGISFAHHGASHHRPSCRRWPPFSLAVTNGTGSVGAML